MSAGGSDHVQYSLSDDVATITFDDGKANALSRAAIDAINAALDRAETEAKAVVFAGRPGRFSAGFDLSVILPVQPKVTTVAAVFDTLESAMFATFIGHVIAYSAFVLPIMLVLGAGTRFVALALLGLTVLMQLFIAPQALWTAHVYWAAILIVLMSLGAGKISVDQIVRMIRGR